MKDNHKAESKKECEVISIADQKGGVGKSTAANFISHGLAKAKKGNRVLLIDFDPQASQTNSFMGFSDLIFAKNDHESDISKIFKGNIPIPLKVNDLYGDYLLDFIPSNEKLVEYIEADSFTYEEKIKALGNFIKKIKHNYDYIVIDTQPLFGVLTKSAILSSDVLFVPIATRGVDSNGVKRFFDKANDTLIKYNHKMKKVCILPTMYQKVVNDSKAVLLDIGLLPNFIRTMKMFKESSIELFSELPQRSIIASASARAYFFVDMVEAYGPYDKDTKNVVKHINSIVKKLK